MMTTNNTTTKYTPSVPTGSPAVDTSIRHDDQVRLVKDLVRGCETLKAGRVGMVLAMVDMKAGDSFGKGDLKMFPPIPPEAAGRYYVIQFKGSKAGWYTVHYTDIAK